MSEFSDDEVKERLLNEYREMMEMCTNRVVISRVPVEEGSGVLVHFRITVHGRTYYLTTEDDTEPKETDQITFNIKVNNGFPRVKPDVYFDAGKRLAGVNTFRNGFQCIDEWLFDRDHASKNSSLAGTMRKTIMDIIHVESVTRYDSMANGKLEAWQRAMTKKGLLPSCNPSEIFKCHGASTVESAQAGMVGLPAKANKARTTAANKSGYVPLPVAIGGTR